MKERVTVTLDSDILRHVDDMVDGFKVKNRSHAIELLINQSLGLNNPKVALIAAAGTSETVKENGVEVPMCMARLHGRPVLEHVVDLFRKFGVKQIFIGVSFLKDTIIDYFGDGSEFSVNIQYLQEDKPSGTTSLLRKIKPFVSGPFFVAHGDEIKELDLFDMLSFHMQSKGVGTIALTTVKDPSVYGVVNMDGINIRSFTEKPQTTEGSNIINSGLYLFNPDIFDMIPDDSTMLYDFLPQLADDNALFGYIFSGQWYDVSTVRQLRSAKKRWKDIR